MANKLYILNRAEGAPTIVLFCCPGCLIQHRVYVNGAHDQNDEYKRTWQWNGSLDAPTFLPLLCFSLGTKHACHSMVTEGAIKFLIDCSHEMRGQTVKLPDFKL
jgi:hypothetical protein